MAAERRLTEREKLVVQVMTSLLAAHIGKIGIITYADFTGIDPQRGTSPQVQLGELAEAIVAFVEDRV